MSKKVKNFSYIVEVKLDLTQEVGSSSSTVKGVNIYLEPSLELKKDLLVSNSGVIKSEAGVKAATVTLIQGLVGTIKTAEFLGLDSVEHVKYAEKLFRKLLREKNTLKINIDKNG